MKGFTMKPFELRSDLIKKNLKGKAQKGSKPRCHWLTHKHEAEKKESVAARLTGFIKPFGNVSKEDNWMPEGFENIEEAQLHKKTRLLDENISEALRAWWFASGNPSSPNFDIASTCTITVDGEKKGRLLIEAKAHDLELFNETKGKPLTRFSDGSLSNHLRIGECIQEANESLEKQTGLKWRLSRDLNYQMSNRFAWAWKLTELGISVILIYLGFLNAKEMETPTKQPFENHDEWEELVKCHSKILFPEEIWNKAHKLNGQYLIPLIRSIDIES
jgi:hypothetical protein